MGSPSFEASNAIIYVTYGAFLLLGTGLAWKMRNQSKTNFLSGNRSQSAIPIALNFIAAAMGSGILFSYPQLATLAGLQGVIVYAISSSFPLLVFAALVPIIRRKCPEGFVLTEWAKQRFGTVTALYLGALTLLTLFLYMVAELSAIGQVINALTGLYGLPVIIVECIITTIYTSLGGFTISFLTDNVQGAMICCLIIIAAVTVGVKVDIQPDLIRNSPLLEANLVGWQLIYILPIAILTNQFFLANFWLRAFASRTDKDLWIGLGIASVVIFCILLLVGFTGLVAVWSGAFPGDPPADDGSIAFFLLLEQLPNWVVGIVIVMVVALSTAAFDSLQSAMVSSASNDVFRNRLNIWWIRAGVVLVMIPVVVIAIQAPGILQIYLISDLLSAAVIPVLVLGLSDRLYFWRGFEVVVGGLGGILTVFIFGTIYYDSPQQGGELILLQQGLYTGDWGAFGAFVAAPVGGVVWGCIALAFRLAIQFVQAKVGGRRFDAFDRPVEVLLQQREYDSLPEDHAAATMDRDEVAMPKVIGKFF